MKTDTNEPDHVFLKDRMAGKRGWLKTIILGISSLIMLSMLATNLLQSF